MKSVLPVVWRVIVTDLKVHFRGYFQTSKPLVILAICMLTAILFGFHWAAWQWISYERQGPTILMEVIAWYFFLTIMLGVGVREVVAVLYDRGTTELLLSSPLSSGMVLFSRMTAITIAVSLSIAPLLLPVINVLIIRISWTYVAGYIVWFLLAFSCAAIAVFITMALVYFFGLRRTKVFAQILGSILPVSFAIPWFIWQFWQGELVSNSFELRNQIWTILDAIEKPPFSLIAHATHMDLIAIAAIVTFVTLLVLVVLGLTSNMFIESLQETATRSSRSAADEEYYMESGLSRITFQKDLKMILRDPLILSRTLPPIFYILPLVLIFSRSQWNGALAALTIFATAHLASTLTAIATAGEECAYLLFSSPASRGKIRRGKMMAGLIVPILFTLLMTIMIALVDDLKMGFITLIAGIFLSLVCGWIELLLTRPMAKADLLRGKQWDLLNPVRIIEFVFIITSMIILYLVAMESELVLRLLPVLIIEFVGLIALLFYVERSAYTNL